MIKSSGYRYPLKLTAPPRPWEWGGIEEQEQIIIESSAKSSTLSQDLVTSIRKHSSTRSALEGERVNKCTMVASKPKHIYNKGRTGQ